MLTSVLSAVLCAAQPVPAVEQLTAMDRAVQQEAVRSIAQGSTNYDAALIDLWKSTDRFDVRLHIVEALKGRGEAGLPALVEITSVRVSENELGVRNLLQSAFTDIGPASFDAIVEGIEGGETRLAYTLALTVKRLDADPIPLANRLIASSVPEARKAATMHLVPLLPLPSRARIQVQLAQDSDQSVRQTTAGYGFTKWSAEDRAAYPDAYVQYAAALRHLVDSEDDQVVRYAIGALISNQGVQPEDSGAFERIWQDESRAFWARVLAMRGHLVATDYADETIAAVLNAIDQFPSEACIALVGVDPDRFDDAAIQTIVEALPVARGREEEFAADLIVQRSYNRDRRRIGLRALPALINALRSTDENLSGYAAGVIRSLESKAMRAVPELITQLKSRGRSWQGERYVNALLAIAPDDPRVRDVLTEVIRNTGEEGAERYVAGNALQALLRTMPDAEWVQKLAEPAMTSPEHPLHGAAMHYPPAEVADIIERDIARLIAEVADTSALETEWAYAIGERADRPDLQQCRDERTRRRRAAVALRAIDEPGENVLDVLIDALRNPIFASPRPPEWGEYDHQDKRAVARDSIWTSEQAVVRHTATTMAKLIDGDTHRLTVVVDELDNHPRALAWVLSSRRNDLNPSREIDVPVELPQDARQVATQALLSIAAERTPGEYRQKNVINAIGLFEAVDDAAVATLQHIVMFGMGEHGPVAAMAAVGHAERVTPELLGFIETHFDDPRPWLRVAAYRAAGHAGESAQPLIDALIARAPRAFGRHGMRSASRTVVIEALRKIAPEDPRVLAFIAADAAEQEAGP